MLLSTAVDLASDPLVDPPQALFVFLFIMVRYMTFLYNNANAWERGVLAVDSWPPYVNPWAYYYESGSGSVSQ